MLARSSVQTLCAICTGLLGVFTLPSTLFAADYTWSGGTNAFWNSGGNWDQAGDVPGFGPSTTDNVIFNATSTANLATSNDITALTINSLQINGSPSSAVSIAGNSFTIGAGGIDMSTAGVDLTMTSGVVAAVSQSWNVQSGRTLTVSTNAASITAGTLALNGAGTTVISSNLTLTGSLAVSNGVVTLSGGNSGAGGVTVNSGTLNINTQTALGTGTFVINGGTLDNTSVGGFTLSTNNVQTWAGDFTYNGTQNLNFGTGAVSMSASRTVTVNASNLTVGGVISGTTFGITKAGAGTLTLSGTNTFTGPVVLNGGVLAVSTDLNLGAAPGAFNASAITLNGGTLRMIGGANATVSVNRGITLGASGGTIQNTTTFEYRIHSQISGTGQLTFSNTSTPNIVIDNNTNLPGVNLSTYSGGTIIAASAGTGAIIPIQSSAGTPGNPTSGPFGTGVIRYEGGNFRGTSLGPVTLHNSIELAANTTIPTGGTVFTFAGPMTIVGATRTLTNNSASLVNFTAAINDGGNGYGFTHAGTGTTVFSGTNTFTGPVTITNGVLSVTTLTNGGAPGTLGNTSSAAANLILNGGALGYSGAVAATTDRNFTIGTAGGGFDASGTVATATLTISIAPTFSGTAASHMFNIGGTNTGANTLSANLVDNAPTDVTILNKIGAGTWTITGNSIHTGGTLLSGGTLNIGNGSALGTGALNIAGTTTFNNTTGSTLTVTNGLTLSGGTAATFTGTNDITFSTGTVLITGGNRNITTTAGTITLGGTIAEDITGRTLTKAGAGGTLTITGTNTITGGINLTAGLLNLGSANPLGTGALVIGGNGTFDNTTGSLLTVANALTLSGGSPTFLGTNSMTFNGLVAISGANRTITVNANTLTLANSVSGAFTLTKVGNGTLTLNGSNSFTGFTLTSGPLNLGNANALGTGALTFTAGSIDNPSGPLTMATTGIITFGGDHTYVGTNNLSFANGTVQSVASRIITLGGTSRTLTFGQYTNTGNISTTLTVNGTGNTVVFNGIALTIASATAARTLTLAGSANVDITGAVVNGLAAFAHPFTVTSNGTVNITGNVSNTGLFTVNSTNGVVNLSGNRTGIGGITLTAGTLNITSTANTHTGANTLSGGTLNIASTTAFGATAATVALNGGTFDNTSGALLTLANNNAITLGGNVAFTGSNSLNLGTAALSVSGNRTLTLNSTNSSVLAAAQLVNTQAGNSTLTVNGVGNLVTFTGIATSTSATSYTVTLAGSGNINVTGPIINGGTSTAGALTIASTGTVNLTGTNSYGGLSTINNTTGLLNLGSTNALSTGAITITSGRFDNSTGSALTLANTGTVTLNGNFTFVGSNSLTMSTGQASLNSNRTITLGSTNGSQLNLGALVNTQAGNSTLTVNGAGNLVRFNSLALSNDATARTVTFAGTGNTLIVGAITNGVTAGSALATLGTGTTTLTGTATYTGTTSIGGGSTLALGSGGNLGNTAISVGNGGTLAVRPGVLSATNAATSTLSLATSATLSMVDTTTSTFNVTGATTLAPASGVATSLVFELGGTTTAADRLSITGAATVGAAGARISIVGIGSTAPTAGPFTVISAASGLNSANLTLATNKVTIGGVDYSLSLANLAGTSRVTVGAASLGEVYWTGTQGSTWNATTGPNTNWNTSVAGGIDALAQPTGLTDVYFATTTPTPTNLTNTLGTNYTIESLNFLSSSDAVTIGSGNMLTLLGANLANTGLSVASGSAAQTVNVDITLGGQQIWSNASANLLTVGGAITNAGFTLSLSGAGTGGTLISGAISGTGGVTKLSTGLVTLSGANNYSGTTLIDQGTLRFSTNQTLTGGLTFGTYSATPNTGTLDVATTSVSVGSITAQTNSSNASNILINTGNTLTVNGNIALATSLNTSNTLLTASGGGALIVTGAAATISLNNITGTNNYQSSVLDLSGLNSFTANLGTGSFIIGFASDNNSLGTASVLLANTGTAPSNTITAATLTVGGSGAGGTQLLTLGSGSNVFTLTTFNMGTGGRDNSRVQFAGSAGTFTLGTSSARTAVNIGTGTATTGQIQDNLLDLNGHTSTLFISTLALGNQFRNSAGATVNNVMNFNLGSFDATTVQVGFQPAAGGTQGVNTLQSSLNLGGGTVTIGTGGLELANNIGVSTTTRSLNGTVNITGGTVTIANNTTLGAAIRLANNSAASSLTTANGTLSITGGSLTVTGNIIKGISTSPTTATITLNGGTLDLSNNSIGSATVSINNVNLQSGTLQNVAEINNGAALTKTTAGTLNIAGSNTYTGTMAVSAGRLNVNGTTTGGAVTVASTATLGGTGTVGNSVTVSSGGFLAPGTASTVGTLTIGGASLSIAGTHNVRVTNVSNYDRVVRTTGSTALTGSTLAATFDAGYVPTANDLFFIVSGSSSVTGTYTGLVQDGTVATNVNGSGLNVQISYSGIIGTSAITGGTDVVLYVTPEPTTVLLVCAAGAFGYRRIRRRA